MATSKRYQLDTMFRTLADNRRRYVLYYFEETDETTVSLTDLADQLVAWERQWDDETDLSESTHHERMHTELHHSHLPHLDSVNLVEYDARSEIVRQWKTNTIEQCVDANAEELNRLFTVFNLSEAAP